jgi:hypothetical protein
VVVVVVVTAAAVVEALLEVELDELDDVTWSAAPICWREKFLS